MKICPRCKETKDLTEFCKNKYTKDGHTVYCTKCIRELSNARLNGPLKAEYKAKAMFHGMLNRCKHHKRYAGIVDVKVSKPDFVAWATPLIDKFIQEHPEESPTVDRIENKGHYEFGNIRIIGKGENTRRQECNKNIHAPEGMAWCGTCKVYMDRSLFYISKRTANGLRSRCKKCADEEVRSYRVSKHAASKSSSGEHAHAGDLEQSNTPQNSVE